MTEEKLKTQENRNPWSWIPTLYVAEGLPYAIVVTVSVIMYKRLGISNADIAMYTGWLYLPWVIKPLWSPIVDVLKTKRFWIYSTQLLIGVGLAGVAFTIPMPDFFQFTLAFFWLIAFSSATQDISVDGFYMLALTESRQSFFVGIRSMFYRVAIIAGQGLIIIFAGYLESTLALGPAEIKVRANPNKFFEETIKIDSVGAKQLSGNLRLIANPSYLEISTRPQTKESLDFYSNFAHNFNIMNGFTKEPSAISDTTTQMNLVGNIGIVNLYLSKQPDKDDEYIVNLDYLEGSHRIKIIEGKTLKFTSNNWNKPAFTVFQLDSTVSNKTEATFIAQVNKVPLAWIFTFALMGIVFVLFFIYHRTILPKPVSDKQVGINRQSSVIKEFFRTFFRFFEKKKIIIVITFLLMYHLGESQLVKIAAPFMLDKREIGGLGLTTSEVGFIYGTIGIIALVIGGILGGFSISKKGLRFWLWPMLFAINIPSLLYVYMAYTQPTNIWIIYSCIVIEQFGYGFGFTALMMYMIYVSEGEHKTSHYAIATGFMALGVMLPGMFSGFIQEAIGYKFFFIWVAVAAIPSFLIAKFIPLEYQFGKKKLTE